VLESGTHYETSQTSVGLKKVIIVSSLKKHREKISLWFVGSWSFVFKFLLS
jgi:hypothetical protein